MKICTKCKIKKNVSEFYNHKGVKSGISPNCKTCDKERCLKYIRSEKGLINQIYRHQKQTSKKRSHCRPNYTKEELTKWLYSSYFLEIYNNWKKNEYNKWLRPSIDRLDDNLPYTLNNIRLVTWGENLKKEDLKKSKNVMQLDLSGNLIKIHKSLRSASKILKIDRKRLSKICEQEIEFNGFKWKYA